MISGDGYHWSMSTNLMELARSAIKQSGLSMFEVARRAEISYSRVHDLVNGRTAAANADTLGKIIAACGADLQLVWRDGRRGRRRPKGR